MTGLYNIDKPKGLTSADVVYRIRKITGESKVGHMGTLDPQGTGVLLIGLGRATRLFSILLHGNKTYSADFTFGYETDTLDGDGAPTGTTGLVPALADIQTALGGFTGRQSQMPPAYSAKNIDGVRAYQLARAGKPVVLSPSEIEIFSLRHECQTDENTHRFIIECSSGTYIRSLCRDLAKSLNTVAVMTAIRRLRCGRFTAENSVTLERLCLNAPAHLLPLSAALEGLPKVDIPTEKYRLLQNGVRIYTDLSITTDSVIYCNGELFGVGRAREGQLYISVNLYEPK